MRVLRLLDHDPSVVAVGVQPFVLHYRDEAGRASHTPDVFVRHANGTASVVDARPERFTDKADFVRQAAATEAACAEAGWAYLVYSAIDPVFEANLDWLAAGRHQLVDPFGCADAVVAACAEPQRIGDVVARVPADSADPTGDQSPVVVGPVGHRSFDPAQRRLCPERAPAAGCGLSSVPGQASPTRVTTTTSRHSTGPSSGCGGGDRDAAPWWWPSNTSSSPPATTSSTWSSRRLQRLGTPRPSCCPTSTERRPRFDWGTCSKHAPATARAMPRRPSRASRAPAMTRGQRRWPSGSIPRRPS